MTNGEKIKVAFPHYDIEIDEHKGYVRVFYEDFYTTYPLRWWNAEYKEPTTKNDLAVECIVDVLGSYTDLDIPYKREIAENILTKLSSVTLQEPRWIPVSERYPKPEDEYKMFLVTDDKGVVSVQVFYLSIEKEPQPYFSGMINVIAWMPLPKAYREVVEE